MVVLIIGLIRAVVDEGIQTPACTCDVTLRAVGLGPFLGGLGPFFVILEHFLVVLAPFL